MLVFWLFVIVAFLVIASKPLGDVLLNQLASYLEEHFDPEDDRDSRMMTTAKSMALAFEVTPLTAWMLGGVVLTPLFLTGIFAVLLLRWMSYLLKRQKERA